MKEDTFIKQFRINQGQLAAVTEDLVAFVHRVSAGEKTSPAEIAALPEIAKVIYQFYM